MKTIPITILVACCTLLTACNKKSPAATMVATKVTYTHPNAVDGKFEVVLRQELGTNTGSDRSAEQPLSLTDNKVVWFSQNIDASDPSKIRVIVESKMDGYTPESQVLEFDTRAPYPPAAKFKNGLMAAVTPNTYTK